MQRSIKSPSLGALSDFMSGKPAQRIRQPVGGKPAFRAWTHTNPESASRSALAPNPFNSRTAVDVVKKPLLLHGAAAQLRNLYVKVRKERAANRKGRSGHMGAVELLGGWRGQGRWRAPGPRGRKRLCRDPSGPGPATDLSPLQNPV